MEKIKDILQRQLKFQRFVGFPIDSNLEKDRNEMSEKFVFKLIEEAVELRKEFPSVANPWSKKNKEADTQRIREEMSDVFLFFLNLLLVWKVSPDNLLDTVEKVQENNFMKVKEKKMRMLNEEMLGIPGYTIGLGSGNLNPKYIFIGQNPSNGIDHGYKVWSDPADGSSKVLLPILKNLGILDDCYFTNLVKCTTLGNQEPSEDQVGFWMNFFDREIDILLENNPNIKIISMGNFVKKYSEGDSHIQHPAYVLRGGITEEDYAIQVYNSIR